MLPGIAVARSYQRRWLRDDLIAGLALTGLLIPAGMGYATAAGLPPQAGLYATVVPLLAYALVGPSRILVLGPDSSLAPLIAAAVLPLAAGDADRAVALAGMLAVLVGILLLLGGAARLGLVTDLLSKPIRSGYLNGIALVVLVSQLPAFLGFSVPSHSLVGVLHDTADGVRDGRVDGTALALGAASLAVILVVRRFRWPVPGTLITVVGAMVAVAALGLSGEVPVVGALPRGLSAPSLGGLRWADVWDLLPAAAGIAIIAFADTAVLSRVLAARSGDAYAGNQEMAAMGVANLSAGLVGGFPVSASSSRTPVAEQAGSRTQLTGVVGAACIVVFLLAAPGITRYLPSATLAAVVIAAAISLADVRGTVRLLRGSRVEFTLSVLTFLGVALVGVLPGIGVAVALSAAAFVYKAWRPHSAELVRVDDVKGYHDAERHPEGRRVPGLLILRWDAPLFFANGAMFADVVLDRIARAPDPVRWVAVAAEPITDIDVTALDDLVTLDDELTDRGILLVFAELKGPAKDRLERYGVSGRFTADRFFPTLGTAVKAYLSATGTEWVDWEDRPDEPPAPPEPGR